MFVFEAKLHNVGAILLNSYSGYLYTVNLKILFELNMSEAFVFLSVSPDFLFNNLSSCLVVCNLSVLSSLDQTIPDLMRFQNLKIK